MMEAEHGELQDGPLLALTMEEGATSPGKQATSHSLERRGNELSVESRKNSIILTLWFVPVHLWSFVTEQ